MKITYFTMIGVMAGGMLFTSCDSAPKGDEAQVQDAQAAASAGDVTLAADASASKVQFTGYGVGKNHPGNFTIKNGTLTLANNSLTGGSFALEIKSMDMQETADFIDAKLLPHLLSPDFFDAEKFPEATFEITEVKPYTPAQGETVVEGASHLISGNLKLKDQVKNVTFPARVSIENGVLKANANFDINRTDWGMSYGNDESLKDKFISPKVNIVLDITARV
jgi:polyisoprenoid-binding protein YceI